MNAKRVEAMYPLSPMQQGMLFRTLMAAGSGLYLEQATYLLEGELDVDVLGTAWSRALARHAPLRTGFFWERLPQPLQVVFREAALPLQRLDWREMAPAGQEERLAALLAMDRRRDFDLARPPLMRLCVIREGESRHRLLWTHHHLILDGWSVGVLLQEVLEIYRAIRGRSDAVLGPALDYHDYIAWLGAQDQDAAARFWRAALEGLPAAPRLPGERGGASPAARPAAAPGEVRLALGEAETAALAAAARRCGVTLNTVVQGALGLLLGRHTGQDDVVLGFTVAGRPESLPGIDRAVGLFINTLPLRLRIGPQAPVEEYLREVFRQAAEAQAHGASTLPQIQEWSGMPQGTPLFQTLLVFENYPVARGDGDGDGDGLGLALAEQRLFERTEYPLTVVAVPGARLAVSLRHDPERLDRPAALRLAHHLELLLAALSVDVRARLCDLPLLPEAESHLLLREWNDPLREVGVAATLHEMFAARARRSPGAVAASLDGRELTYAELEERANRLAHRLLALGVGPDMPVAVCLERSLDLVVAILGVLVAGGAYVPLDPAYPAERIAFMLEDSGARVVVTRGDLLDRLPADRVTPLCLDRDAGRIAAESAAPPPAVAGPRNLAYVIYTSGSSGRPKGVLVEHAQVMRLFAGTEDLFHFGPEDVWTLFHSFAFDFSVWELWGALLYGGRLVVVPYLVSRSPEAFHELLARERVTVLSQTPSAFRQLVAVEDGAAARDLALRLVVFGGEALELQSLRPWLERHGEVAPRLINMYGITETTVHVTWRPVGIADLDAQRGSVIGLPLPDLQAYVLDAAGRPLPIGVPGEVYIGGAGVSRGYLGRPALTAERFLPDPFAGRPGARLYRTGDLARWLPEGELEYLGRIDHQVKIRGFRIELGEIESTLASHPEVREAVVVPLPEPGDEGARLAAYVVPAIGAAPRADALRAFLRDRLPEHMMPAFLVLLDALPLTANGKLDRRALPAPGAGEPQGARAARNPLEQALAEIWAEVLGLDRIGIDESFFDRGGHSLLATRLISRVRSAFQVDLPLHAVFEAPTVEGMAAEIARALGGGASAEAAPLLPVPRHGPPPASFAQERLWLLDRLSPGNPAWNLRVALFLTGDLDIAALAGTLDTVVARHEALRTTFGEVDGAPVQVIAPAATLPLPVADLAALPEPLREAEARRLADEHAEQRFDLRRGPLVSARLLRLGERESVIAFALHHSAGDGWSLGVLCREVMAVYRDLRAGRPASLPPLPVQYADYAVWQRDEARGATLAAQLAWWRRQLDGPLPPLALPVRQRRSAARGRRGAACRFALGKELAGELRALGRSQGATLSMVLLAAFQVLLLRTTGEEDVRVGTPVAGRTRLETEGLIGCFLNTLVTRVDLSGDPSFRELLGRVRAAVLAAHAHQDVPYERLAQALAPGRDPAEPLFQVLFLLHNFPLPPLDLPGLTARPFTTERRTALADLALELEELDGQGIAAVLAYDADLFERPAVERMAEQYRDLLEEMAAAPDAPVSAPEFAAAPAVRMASHRELEAW